MNQLEADSYTENEILNKDTSLDLVKTTYGNAKKGKAVDIDKIPNEALKHLNCVRLLYTFFKFCFTNSLIPDERLKAITFPIPKLADSEQHILLKYWKIRLLSCIYKLTPIF